MATAPAPAGAQNPAYRPAHRHDLLRTGLTRAFASQHCPTGPTRSRRIPSSNLFAVHLVRSPAFKAFNSRIGKQFRDTDVPTFATDAELIARFQESKRRPPHVGELLDISLRADDELVADPMHLVETMIRQHDRMAEMLNRFQLQVVELAPTVPGLIVGDTPVVHASFGAGRYGFRDHLALGDADFIVEPLTRSTAVCFTARRLSPVLVKKRKMVGTINAVFLRAAQAEVACHPDDAKAIRRRTPVSTASRRRSLGGAD